MKLRIRGWIAPPDGPAKQIDLEVDVDPEGADFDGFSIEPVHGLHNGHPAYTVRPIWRALPQHDYKNFRRKES